MCWVAKYFFRIISSANNNQARMSVNTLIPSESYKISMLIRYFNIQWYWFGLTIGLTEYDLIKPRKNGNIRNNNAGTICIRLIPWWRILCFCQHSANVLFVPFSSIFLSSLSKPIFILVISLRHIPTSGFYGVLFLRQIVSIVML